ncbi:MULTISPECIES: M23 family metallopeptidase [unclassified Cyanobium]|uniref:M23 family metallopeptidase n=1 Tax=unclassified Cyanobium TaxID=2627006 RepID=UPI0020CF6ACB|nr:MULTISPECIES: M23 family metallopeptidase [unclassified Cyanobium]MCP9861232.1 M23 family metallopeptidase [Cyanobium sp. Cruz-8H5]MCP9868481.1 M23 family metallopeptidase [Cyanobium sp. Cruz-8D1]
MAPDSLRRAPALLLLLLLLPGGTAAAAGTDRPGAPGEPPIPDSATGAGAEAPPWPNVLLPPAPSPERVAPAPIPTPAATRPERPALLPREVPVGDLALQARASGAGEAAAGPLAPLHYPLAVAASEQDPWGWRFSQARGAWRLHTGVDLIAPEGTAVLAVQAGRVQRVDAISGYGLTVLIDHGGGWSSLYAHLRQASVAEGDSVGAGQPIGEVGQSGNASTPHLHLEVRQRQPLGLVAVDPTPLLPAPPAGGAIAGDLRP